MFKTGLSQGIFYAYAFLVAPWFARKLGYAFTTEKICPGPGLLLGLALIAETIALPWKFRSWDSSTKAGIPLWLGSAICISHILLTYFLGIYLLDAWGVIGNSNLESWQTTVLGITCLLLFVREGYLFFATSSALRQGRALNRRRQTAGELMLLFFRCIAYTSYWEVMMGIGPPKEGSLLTWLFLSPFLILLFYLVYLPIRMTDILSVYYQDGETSGEKTTWGILISGALLALYPLLGSFLLS